MHHSFGAAQRLSRKMANDSGSGAVCSLFDTTSKCVAIYGVQRTIAVLSLISCVYVVLVIIILKRYKFEAQRLILYLSIAVFLHTLFYAGNDYPDEEKFENDDVYKDFCKFQGWYVVFTAWIIMLLQCVITVNIVLIIVLTQRLGWKADIVYAFVVLVPPTIISVLPFSEDAYGPAGIYCWITVRTKGKTYKPGVAFQFAVFYGPWMLLCLVMAIVLSTVIAVVKYRLRKSGMQGVEAEDRGPLAEAEKKLWDEQIKPLMPFPWIHIFTFILPMINRLRIAAGYDEPSSGLNFALWFFHAFFLPLKGLLFGVAVTLDKNTRVELKKVILRCWRRLNQGTHLHEGPWGDAEARIQEFLNRPPEKPTYAGLGASPPLQTSIQYSLLADHDDL